MDAAHVVVAVLGGLAAEGSLPVDVVRDAIERYRIDPDSPDPWSD